MCLDRPTQSGAWQQQSHLLGAGLAIGCDNLGAVCAVACACRVGLTGALSTPGSSSSTQQNTQAQQHTVQQGGRDTSASASPSTAQCDGWHASITCSTSHTNQLAQQRQHCAVSPNPLAEQRLKCYSEWKPCQQHSASPAQLSCGSERLLRNVAARP
jgi:hypothetical protein